MTQNHHEQIDWKAYYNVEHEVHRFVPETDPTEPYRLAFVRSLLPHAALESVLDAGCGDGYQCSVIAPQTRRVVGLDVALPRLQYARTHHAAPNIAYAAGELTRLPFKPRSFDLVTLVEVLEHLPDPVPVLRSLASLSRRYVLVTVPYKQKPQIILCPHCLKTFPIDGHLRMFDEPSFRATLQEAGLRIVKLDKYFHPSPWESAAATRFLTRTGKRFIRKLLQDLSLITKDNAVFIGALCETP
jgi:SAM-dependent methyltransferase